MGRKGGTDEKSRFNRGIVVAVVLTVVGGIALLLLYEGNAIPCFNVWVDIVVGALTVWALRWAASEFAESAVKPVLRLVPGGSGKPAMLRHPDESSYCVLEGPPFPIAGWREIRRFGGHPAPCVHVHCGLYLTNEKSRAGRHVQIVVRLASDPMPHSWKFSPSSLYQMAGRDSVIGETGHRSVVVQLAEGLVVYQYPVYIGQLILQWGGQLSEGELPRRVVLDYVAYTLDGASRGEVELQVEWG